MSSAVSEPTKGEEATAIPRAASLNFSQKLNVF